MEYYNCNDKGGFDYKAIEEQAMRLKPKLIVCGAARSPLLTDVKKFREIADKVGAVLMFDMSSQMGLIAAGLIDSPLEHAHIITGTGDGVLKGPRCGFVFAVKGDKEYCLFETIKEAVFPGFQGGPHNHYITAMGHALHLAAGKDFKDLQRQALLNSKSFADNLGKFNFDVFTGGTENHVVAVDIKNTNIEGRMLRHWLDRLGIWTELAPLRPGSNGSRQEGLFMGSLPMTERGLREKDFETVSELIKSIINVGTQAKVFEETGDKFLQRVEEVMDSNPNVQELKEGVEYFAKRFDFYDIKE